MNFKRSTTSMAIALMVLSLVSMTSIQQEAFAEGLGMSITATADRGSDTITLTGITSSDITDVTFRITSPSANNVVSIGQLSPDVNGDFGIIFKVGPTWTEDGFYKIAVMQSTHQTSMYALDLEIEIKNGMTTKIITETVSNYNTGLLNSNPIIVSQNAGLFLDAIVIENGSTMFEVTGMTDRVSQDITLTVTAPNGNVVTIDQISPKLDGNFAAEITVGGSLWKQDGFYTVTVQQFNDPKYSASIEVDILDGIVVPEFGTIAAMILAVAIISIIAVSAKSRLSIIPRY